jgi:hypothetical protein
MGQQRWDPPNYDEDFVQQLKLEPDAVVYQAPPQSMHACRYWTHDLDFGANPSEVLNEFGAPVGGAEA